MTPHTVWLCCGVVRAEMEELQRLGLIVGELLFFDSMLHMDPPLLEEKLTAQLRELTGARTVMLLAHRFEPDTDELLYTSPERRSTLFSSAELNLFCVEKTPGELPFLPEGLSADHPLTAPLQRTGVHSMARYPLRVAGELVGLLLLFDLPDVERIAETNSHHQLACRADCPGP